MKLKNIGGINEQVGQYDVTGGQKQFRDEEEYGMNDTNADACSETKKLPNLRNNLLNMMWKTMQEEKTERERIRRETEEKQETNRMEDKEKLEQLIKQIREDVERMKESLVKKCEDRTRKLAANISNLEKKTQRSIVEITRYKVWELHCQRMSEAKVSQAAVLTELVEHKPSVENMLSMFRNELTFRHQASYI